MRAGRPFRGAQSKLHRSVNVLDASQTPAESRVARVGGLGMRWEFVMDRIANLDDIKQLLLSLCDAHPLQFAWVATHRRFPMKLGAPKICVMLTLCYLRRL